MSRIGKKPVPIPQGVTVTATDGIVTVKGPKGELQRRLPAEITAEVADEEVRVMRPSETKRHRSLHGLARTLVANMVKGVTVGYERKLEIQGVGYKAEARGKGIRLVVGLSHVVDYEAPAGVDITIESNTSLTVRGIDKELVGQVAADLRRVRPPEPYKGKGIRYLGEHVRRKAGKTGAKA